MTEPPEAQAEVRRSFSGAAEQRVDQIVLLGAGLLRHSSDLPSQFAQLARRLGIELGWHYLLDLTWIALSLPEPQGLRILDAGAGTGVLQWWLARQGAYVMSADRLDRADLSIRFRQRYHVQGLRGSDLIGLADLARRRLQSDESLSGRLVGAAKALGGRLVVPVWPKPPGVVTLYNQNLDDLHDIESGSVDYVVSVSALEHNPPADLRAIVEELQRILKPGGCLLVTLAAAKQEDWFHEPSQGWCYSEASLESSFGLAADRESNFDRFDEVFADIRASNALRSQLSSHYFESGQNGMPWGIWDPKYVPVGIMKWKRTT